MAKKVARRPKAPGNADGFVVRGPDGKLYFIPVDALEQFKLPEPLQPDVRGSEISKTISKVLQQRLEDGMVLDLGETSGGKKSPKVGRFVIIFGK